MAAKGFSPTLTNGDITLPTLPGTYATRVNEEITALWNAIGGFAAGPLVSSARLVLNGDVVLTHPLTPTPDNDARTNIGLGVGALISLAPIHSTQYLTAIGFQALASATTADHNTAVGAWSLASLTTGNANTAIGIDALRILTTGGGNVAIGEHCLASVVTGTNNTSIGIQSSYYVTGDNNTAIGISALQSVAGTPLTGGSNVAVGGYALAGIITTAFSNTAVGYQALTSLTTGTVNTAIGAASGLFITTGNYNICIGSAGATLVSGNDNILIGTVSHPADTPAAGTSNYLNIANTLYATSLGGAALAGVMTPAPTKTWDITGTLGVSGASTLLGNVTIGGTANLAISHGGAVASSVNLANSLSNWMFATSASNTSISWSDQVNGVNAVLASGGAIGTGSVSVGYTKQATTTTDGALAVAGGLSVAKSAVIGIGLQIGAPTGGDKGAGTINCAADIYKNNTAYTNPDFVFEHFYRGGQIKQFAANERAKGYGGLMPLGELRKYTQSNLRLPRISDESSGMFERGDIALEKIEEAHLYIMALHERVAVLESHPH